MSARSATGSPVHIALNATFLDPGASGGPESYIRGLIPALAAARPDSRLSVLTSRRGAAGLRADGWQDFATIVALPCDEGERTRRLAAETLRIPSWVRSHRPSLLHSTASLGPPFHLASPQVVTLHDLTFLRIPTFGKATTLMMSRLALGSARHAARVITATNASLNEIVALGGIDRAGIDVVPHGRRAIGPVSSATVAEVRTRLELGGVRVVLCVAAKRPHKNQELLIRAMPSLPADVVLALAGHPEAYDQELRALAEELGVAGRVRFVDYAPDDELEALWQLASAAAFPTRGEGFGLPVIEAMDRGVPVACSRIPVLEEVAGGFAHLFDPDNPAEAATQIEAALADDSGEAGRRAHAATFSWERAAQETWDSYDRALAAAR